eukprot:6126119-Alexandrium_andersonii.AAC.1
MRSVTLPSEGMRVGALSALSSFAFFPATQTVTGSLAKALEEIDAGGRSTEPQQQNPNRNGALAA